MRIRLGYELSYDFPQPTPMIVTLNVHHSRASDLVVPDTMRTDPAVPHVSYRDSFGNWVNRLKAPPGWFTLRSQTVINDSGLPDEVPEVGEQHPVEDLPQETLIYLLGSRYCETDKLSNTAWQLFGGIPPGWARVQAINDFVHRHITFGYGFASPTKTAFEAFEEGRGVCRDFAHLGVALCRAMNIPARYCTGYLGDIGVPASADPMDFSGWFEVYLSGRWYTVDPRNHVPRIGRILIARGRDAADVAMVTSFGPSLLTGFTVWTDEVTDAEPAAVINSASGAMQE